MGFCKSAQFTLNVFEIKWLPCSISKDQAKISHIKIYNEISIIRFYGAAIIEEHGKISPCYKKNISQDTTCRKILVVDCAKKVLDGFGLTEVCSSGWKKISCIFLLGSARKNGFGSRFLGKEKGVTILTVTP
jgi:hypothetical protein